MPLGRARLGGIVIGLGVWFLAPSTPAAEDLFQSAPGPAPVVRKAPHPRPSPPRDPEPAAVPAPPPPTTPAPPAATAKCFAFNGKQFCE
jgi:hypothetical protein